MYFLVENAARYDEIIAMARAAFLLLSLFIDGFVCNGIFFFGYPFQLGAVLEFIMSSPEPKPNKITDVEVNG